ncbi:MAG: glycosyltransferase family 9 protein [Verrucomicrobiota bacterium]
MTKSRGKILVIRGGAIGDFILTLPVLSALRAQFPDTHLEVLGYSHITELAREGGLVEDVRHIEARPLAAFFSRGLELEPGLVGYFAGFSIILSYLYDPDLLFQSSVVSCSDAQFIVAPHRPDESQPVHATEVFLKPLERLAIFGADPVPRLSFSPQTNGVSGHSFLALHPGSGSEKKNWPETRWAELVQMLVSQTPHRLLLVGGEAEGARLERLMSLIPAGRGRLLRNSPLVEVGRTLQHCAGFIGHDSGITHLAAAVGLKTLVLWGESNEHIWRPRSERATIVRNPGGIAAVTPAEVLNKSNEMLRS